jgi:hypothetical protein
MRMAGYIRVEMETAFAKYLPVSKSHTKANLLHARITARTAPMKKSKLQLK